ncbi:MAG: pentapeptide repeat-containing protein [Gordonia sp. (in: high G+C Gram-positive bacteria)]|uniref:pentapeptide repeat-containing protein n=1 Tax=Gordonia sp. (in: high G+C Gram-positive bacteria) TaxID=84139 RepID=UPI003BB4CAE1
MKIPAPIINEPALYDLTDDDAACIEAGAVHEARRYTEADLADRELSGTEFSVCEFRGLHVDDAQLLGARFTETRIARLTATNLRAARTTWRDAVIEASRIGAAELYDADLHSVRISGTKISFANLRGARLRDVFFDDCVIDELDLSQARAERVAFGNTVVRTLLVDHAQLKHVDLRGLELGSFSGVEFLRGAVISARQAAELSGAFARHLGVAVAD